MALFMDLHKASDYDVKPTVDEIKRNHIADLEVQDKYGVKFLQYWINEEAGLVFCLMEAPDKESCAAVHREAHGAMPCNIIELQGGDYIAFMGNEGSVNEFDIAETGGGSLDTGYRIILAADIISAKNHEQIYNSISRAIKETAGRSVNRSGGRETIVFTSAMPAIECAIKMITEVQSMDDPANETRIGISAGEPVTEQGDFFGYSIQLANRLCDIAQNNQVIISPLVKQLAGEISLQHIKEPVKVLNPEEEIFLNQLSEAANAMISGPAFNIAALGKHLGLSKSQLYRKINSLTGRPANNFIKELRLQKAYKLIRNKYGNVSEVAFETGFSSPSYFTRSFQKRFDILPLQVLKRSP
ncbi:MAG TPA: nickel-binding protein [Chitinophagaceae bacterium]|nr:nickel-binding protein [Chitinophagaceae bacterium]